MTDFTADEFVRLLRLVKKDYKFVSYLDSLNPPSGKQMLWRHDIDYSPVLAERMATIEVGEGIRSTYFVHLHSRFYNALDPESVSCIKHISNLGHDIGLHIDPIATASTTLSKIGKQINSEKKILEDILGIGLTAVSIHNPSMIDQKTLSQYSDRISINCLINTQSDEIVHRYKFVSDSNQIWKYGTIEGAIGCSQLQILTHPIWWMVEGTNRIHKVENLSADHFERNILYYMELTKDVG